MTLWGAVQPDGDIVGQDVPNGIVDDVDVPQEERDALANVLLPIGTIPILFSDTQPNFPSGTRPQPHYADISSVSTIEKFSRRISFQQKRTELLNIVDPANPPPGLTQPELDILADCLVLPVPTAQELADRIALEEAAAAAALPASDRIDALVAQFNEIERTRVRNLRLRAVTETNVNTTTPTPITWQNPVPPSYSEEPGLILAGTKISFDKPGYLNFRVQASTTSFADRTNMKWVVERGGQVVRSCNGTFYARHQSNTTSRNHNDTSGVLVDSFELTANEEIEIFLAREAEAGTVQLVGPDTVFVATFKPL